MKIDRDIDRQIDGWINGYRWVDIDTYIYICMTSNHAAYRRCLVRFSTPHLEL